MSMTNLLEETAQHMRLFIAIPLSQEFHLAAKNLQKALFSHGVRGRYVPEENFHITLRFIGECNQPDDITEAMKRVCCHVPPFPIRLLDCEGFGGGRTLYLSVSCDNGEIDLLYHSLNLKLNEYGIVRNRDCFAPHITLGRNMSGFEGFCWNKPSMATCRIEEIVLYESVRTDKVRYHAIHREKLI